MLKILSTWEELVGKTIKLTLNSNYQRQLLAFTDNTIAIIAAGYEFDSEPNLEFDSFDYRDYDFEELCSSGIAPRAEFEELRAADEAKRRSENEKRERQQY